jgi:hypothetical protein
VPPFRSATAATLPAEKGNGYQILRPFHKNVAKLRPVALPKTTLPKNHGGWYLMMNTIHYNRGKIEHIFSLVM